MNFYYYVYYAFVRVLAKVGGKNFPRKAFFAMSLTVGINLITVLILLVGNRIKPINPDLTGILIAVLIGLINYVLLWKDGKYKTIIEFYDKRFEIKSERNFAILVLVYVAVSIALVLYVANLARNNVI